jgi:ribosome assembly protein YihI (activator of Der GTPase)
MCVGIPLLILKVAENQKRIEKFILDNQCGVSFVEATNNLNSFNSFLDSSSGMLKNQGNVIDGKSDERILDIVDKLLND